MKEQLTVKALYAFPEHTRAWPLLEKVEYPWEVLPEISDFILALGPTLPKEIFEWWLQWLRCLWCQRPACIP